MAARRSAQSVLVVVGILALGFLGGVAAVVALLHQGPDSIRFTSTGADVSAHGGKRLEVRSGRGTISQTCNGICDDLKFTVHGSDDSYRVRVLDANGRDVAKGGAGYVTNGYTTSLTVSGREKLEIRSDP